LEIGPSIKIDLSTCSKINWKNAFASLHEGAKEKAKVENVLSQIKKRERRNE